jgi:putative ABC transport system ATP-binding protein
MSASELGESDMQTPSHIGIAAIAPALELRSVVKRFGEGTTEVRALTDVSLSVAAGELVALMGPSGCGKSTLLHLAGGLDDPSAGSVLVDGRDIATLNLRARAALRRRDVGYVFQRLNLVPSLTALENVQLPLELDGVSARESRERAREALTSVGITDQIDRFPDDFSGGQQQRIAVARAVVGTRKLLLADEPTGALDTLTGDAVVELLAGLPATLGTAIVLVTHEPRYAAWADRVVFMRDGRIVDESTVGSATPDSPAPAAVGH